MKKKRRFGTWCAEDPDDERKINYTYTDKAGRTKRFTSDEIVSWEMLGKLYVSWIDSIELKNNEWYVKLHED